MRLGSFQDPRSLLVAVMQNDKCDPALRVRAATTLLQHELAEEKFRAQLFVEEEIAEDAEKLLA